MEKDPRARLKKWLASGEARLVPLTFPQREIWENSPVAPGDPANNICSFFEVKGAITIDQVESAIRKVIERQEVMRTSFLPGKERPVQIIRSTGEPALRFRELSEAEAQPEALEEVMAESYREPFDLLRGPLYRMDMLQRAPDDFVVAFTIHHAVADGWTLGAFVQDLCTAYVLGLKEPIKALAGAQGLRESLASLPMSYSQWGAAERARWQPEEIDRKAQYWKKQLEGSKLLWDRTGAGKSGLLQRWVTAFPSELADAVRGLARKSGSTVFSTLLAAFQLTLFKWTGTEDIIVGSPVANRARASAGETMGYFSGIVPMRGIMDRRQSFASHLGVVHESTMDAFTHAMPFAELARSLGEPKSPGKHTVFDTRFAFQNHPIPDEVLPGFSTKLRVRSTGTARFDIACEMTEDDTEFEVVWLYQPSVIPLADVRGLDGMFREVLTAVCKNPDILPGEMTV